MYILLYNYINDIIILQIFVWASEVKPFQLKSDKNGLSRGFKRNEKKTESEMLCVWYWYSDNPMDDL